MKKKVEKKHVDLALKALDKNEFVAKEACGDITKRKKIIEEFSYIRRLINALWDDCDCLRKQPPML